MSTFPIVRTRAFPCFHCAEPIDPATGVDDGFPPGRGQYRAACPACGRGNHFDRPERDERQD